jgi:hypothetical protein
MRKKRLSDLERHTWRASNCSPALGLLHKKDAPGRNRELVLSKRAAIVTTVQALQLTLFEMQAARPHKPCSSSNEPQASTDMGSAAASRDCIQGRAVRGSILTRTKKARVLLFHCAAEEKEGRHGGAHDGPCSAPFIQRGERNRRAVYVRIFKRRAPR